MKLRQSKKLENGKLSVTLGVSNFSVLEMRAMKAIGIPNVSFCKTYSISGVTVNIDMPIVKFVDQKYVFEGTVENIYDVAQEAHYFISDVFEALVEVIGELVGEYERLAEMKDEEEKEVEILPKEDYPDQKPGDNDDWPGGSEDPGEDPDDEPEDPKEDEENSCSCGCNKPDCNCGMNKPNPEEPKEPEDEEPKDPEEDKPSDKPDKDPNCGCGCGELNCNCGMDPKPEDPKDPEEEEPKDPEDDPQDPPKEDDGCKCGCDDDCNCGGIKIGEEVPDDLCDGKLFGIILPDDEEDEEVESTNPEEPTEEVVPEQPGEVEDDGQEAPQP